MGTKAYVEEDPALRYLGDRFGDATPEDRDRIRSVAADSLSAIDEDRPDLARAYQVAAHVLGLRIAAAIDDAAGFPGKTRWARGEYLLEHPTDYDPVEVRRILAEEELAALATGTAPLQQG